MEVATYCPSCKQNTIHQVDSQAFLRWQEGELIQVCFPDMAPEVREQFITGTCPKCWEEMFGYVPWSLPAWMK